MHRAGESPALFGSTKWVSRFRLGDEKKERASWSVEGPSKKSTTHSCKRQQLRSHGNRRVSRSREELPE